MNLFLQYLRTKYINSKSKKYSRMEIIGKRGMWVVVLAILLIILPLNIVLSASLTCNDGTVVNQDQPNARRRCIISTNQTIIASSGVFYFSDLKIDEGVVITVQSPNNNPNYCGGCLGGTGGESQNPGGDGGDGGNRLYGGQTGDTAPDTCGADGGAGGVGGGIPGGYLSIDTYNLTLKGSINASGSPGAAGGDGEFDDCGHWNDDQEAGGGGGGGGSGGGIVIIKTGRLFQYDTAAIEATGGNGGQGGRGDYSDYGNTGASGGGGAGGIGGIITINALSEWVSQDTSKFNSNGGIGGASGQCVGHDGHNCETNNYGQPGADGSAGEINIADTVPEENCNDNIDNDYDNKIDMQDSDCFNIFTDGGVCPSLNYGPVSGPNPTIFPDWFQHTSTTGADACCGDDMTNYGTSCNGNLNVEECTDLSYSQCSSFPECSRECHGTPPSNYCEQFFINNPTHCPTSVGCIYNNPEGSCNPPNTAVRCSDFADEGEAICESYGCTFSYGDVNGPDFCTGTVRANKNTCGELTQTECGYVSSCYYQDQPATCTTPNPFYCGGDNDCHTSIPECTSSCTGGTLTTTCEDLSLGICTFYGCTIPNTLGDLGFLIPSNQWMCYFDNSSSWEWLDAQRGTPYQILKLNELGIDVVSNDVNWSYCDATGNHSLGITNGRAIQNFGTFADSLEVGQCLCPDTPEGFFLLPEGECNSEYASTIRPCCGVLNPDTYDSDRPDYLCDSNPYFPPGQGGCMKCYDEEGNDYPAEPGQSEPGDSYLDKEFWPGFNGYGWSPSLTCEENNGYICNASFSCENGAFMRSRDSDRCCWNPNGGQYCQLIPDTNDMTCLGINPANIIITSQDIENGFHCNNIIESSDTDGSNTFCCSDGYWWNTNNISSANQNNSFICYQEQNKNLFGECCYGSECNNVENPVLTELREFDNGNLFTTGSPLHTIDSFNTYLTGVIRDRILKADLRPTGRPAEDYYRDIYEFKDHDWNQFTSLEFDLGYYSSDINNYAAITNISFFSGNTVVFSDDIWNYTILQEVGGQANVWHHIIFDLTQISNRDNITKVRIQYTPAESSFLYLDNFALYSTDPDLDKRYCAGAFHSWIEELNPVNYDPDNFMSYGPYWYACDAQMSFKWSGTRCCGSRTKVSDLESEKEFYIDKWSGCYAGVPVLNDQTIGDAYHNAGYLQNIMYYNKEFYECGAWSTHGRSESLGGLGNITTIQKDYFDIVGSRYCDPDRTWKSISAGVFTKILAAKLYNLTYNIDASKEDFSLYCDSADNAINKVWDNITKGNFCVLNMRKSGGEDGPHQVIIGTTADIEELLIAINSTHPPFARTSQNNDYDISGEMITACKHINTDNATSFFVKCLDGSEYNNMPLYIYYNTKFKLVLLSEEPIEGLEPTTGFFKAVWDFFKQVFCFLFQTCNHNEGRNVIPIPESEADFEKLFISRNQDLFVRGIEEKNRNAGYSASIEFHNFTTDLKFLTEGRIINTSSKNYYLGTDKQIITYLFYQSNYDSEIFKKLTSGMRIRYIDGDRISDSLGNGYAGWDEECDCLVNGRGGSNGNIMGYAPGPQPAPIVCSDNDTGADFKGEQCDIPDGFLSCDNGIIDYSGCGGNGGNGGGGEAPECGNLICDPNESCEIDSCCNGISVDLNTDPNNCHTCNNVCPQDYVCISGVCQENNGQPQDTCSETDDGQDYTHAGRAFGFQNQVFVDNYDSCINSTVLSEWYCSGNTITDVAVLCDLGCVYNRCETSGGTPISCVGRVGCPDGCECIANLCECGGGQ